MVSALAFSSVDAGSNPDLPWRIKDAISKMTPRINFTDNPNCIIQNLQRAAPSTQNILVQTPAQASAQPPPMVIPGTDVPLTSHESQCSYGQETNPSATYTTPDQNLQLAVPVQNISVQTPTQVSAQPSPIVIQSTDVPSTSHESQCSYGQETNTSATYTTPVQNLQRSAPSAQNILVQTPAQASAQPLLMVIPGTDVPSTSHESQGFYGQEANPSATYTSPGQNLQYSVILPTCQMLLFQTPGQASAQPSTMVIPATIPSTSHELQGSNRNETNQSAINRCVSLMSSAFPTPSENNRTHKDSLPNQERKRKREPSPLQITFGEMSSSKNFPENSSAERPRLDQPSTSRELACYDPQIESLSRTTETSREGKRKKKMLLKTKMSKKDLAIAFRKLHKCSSKTTDCLQFIKEELLNSDDEYSSSTEDEDSATSDDETEFNPHLKKPQGDKRKKKKPLKTKVSKKDLAIAFRQVQKYHSKTTDCLQFTEEKFQNFNDESSSSAEDLYHRQEVCHNLLKN